MSALRRPAVAILLAACGASRGVETAPGRWEARSPVPDARTEVSVATDGALVYLVGGFGRRARGGDPAPRRMLVYDPGADRWSEAGQIPEGVNHAGLAAVAGKLYLIGGFRQASSSPSGAVRIYDPATRTWHDGAPMPTPRGALAVAVLGGKIHAIGGNAPRGRDLPAHEHGVSRHDRSVGTHEVYDPATDSWTRRAPMPTARNHLGAAAIGGKIHAVGGRVPGDMELTAHEVYDPATDSWTEAPPLPTGRSGIAVVAHREQLYVFGGETVRLLLRKTFEQAERFDPLGGRWQRLPPMPTARHGLGAASAGGAIYVVSGGPRPGLTFSDANERLEALP